MFSNVQHLSGTCVFARSKGGPIRGDMSRGHVTATCSGDIFINYTHRGYGHVAGKCSRDMTRAKDYHLHTRTKM